MAVIVLVVPCYNEARRLDVAAFLEALDAESGLRLVFVNDGSSDDTQSVLEGLAASRPERVEVLHLDANSGKAEAVRRGTRLALEPRPDFFGYWDADLATPLDAVTDLRLALEERDELLLAMGARVQLLGRDIQRSAVRHYLGRVFATFASLTLHAPVYDTQCGAKLFRRTAETEGLFDTPFLARWIFDVELLARLGGSLEARVVEVPLRRWIDRGDSRVKGRDFLTAFRDLLRIRRHYRPGRRDA